MNASHYDDDDDDNSNYEEPEGDHDGDNREEISSSVMREYLQSIQKQIRDEGNTKRTEEVVDRWIIEYLKVNDFYLHSQMSSYICGRLGIQHAIDGYYKSVLVWLPDLQFDCLPPCPCCGYSNRVGVHGYEGKTLARKIIGIKSNYFVLSRRYICHQCKTIGDRQYTYHAYHPKSVEKLPRYYGMKFPAFLTRKLGLDKSLIDLMRPILDSGMKVNAFRNMILELHTQPRVPRQRKYTCLPFGSLSHQLPPVQIPPMISPVHPANYQLYHSTTYVGGYSTTMYPPPTRRIPINQTIAREDIRVRGKDKSKRSKRRCKKYCNFYNCEGAKTRARKGKILRCWNLPIVIFAALLGMEREDFINTYHDHDNVSSEKSRTQIMAIFLRLLFHFSKENYDNEQYWHDFECDWRVVFSI